MYAQSGDAEIVAADDDEQYIEFLEAAYADADEAKSLQERMKNDTGFGVRCRAKLRFQELNTFIIYLWIKLHIEER